VASSINHKLPIEEPKEVCFPTLLRFYLE
jgi:hypothetical protein